MTLFGIRVYFTKYLSSMSPLLHERDGSASMFVIDKGHLLWWAARNEEEFILDPDPTHDDLPERPDFYGADVSELIIKQIMALGNWGL